MVLRWQDRIGKSDAWLLSFLVKNKVPFVIFGGAAVAYHGCRDNFYFDDMDVLLSPTEANSKRFALAMNAAAKAAGKQVTAPFPPLKMVMMGQKFNLDISEFHIDFLTMFKPSVFNDLMKNAVSTRIGLLEVKLVSLKDLVWLKEKGINDSMSRVKFYAEDVEKIKQCLATEAS